MTNTFPYSTANLSRSLTASAVAIVTMLSLSTTTLAMGYSSISCEDLWERKQTVYKNNFYCLTEQDAITKFGNDECRFKTLSEIAFNSEDMDILALIARNEERKKCPKATPLLKETPLFE